MRLRLFFFDVDRQEYHGQWIDTMRGAIMPIERYSLMMDTENLVTKNIESDEDILSDIWAYTQNANPRLDDKHWREAMAPEQNLAVCRSSCVGDIIILDERVYRIETLGFLRVADDVAEQFLTFGA